MHVVKAYLLSGSNIAEIRRLVFGSSLNLNKLLERIREIYNITDNQPIRLQWLDPDGDRVVFSTDSELQEALSCSQTAGQEALKVYISRQTSPPDTPHPNVLCDGCERPVRGYRFKCVICSDFDLCGCCMAMGKHSEHPMLLLRRPRDPFYCKFNRWNRSSWMRCRQGQRQAADMCHQVMREIDRVAKRCARLQGCYGLPQAQSTASASSAASTTSATSAASAATAATGDGQQPAAGDMLQVVNSVSTSLNSILQPLGIDVSWYSGHEAQRPAECPGGGQRRTDAAGQQADASGHQADASGHQADAGSGQNSEDSRRQRADSADTGPDDLVMVDVESPKPSPPSLPPQVATALQQMLAMGFSDDGGRLTDLLVATDGDIDRTLDAIRQN